MNVGVPHSSQVSTQPMGVAILGATGSIGDNTLDVIARHPQQFSVVALAANCNVVKLKAQCLQFKPRFAALADPAAAKQLQQELAAAGSATAVLAGPAALDELAAHPDVHSVMAAIVGAAGLSSTLAAARAGKRILLANKESLVMSGPLFMREVQAGGAQLIPIDSEHNAIFQCLPPQRLSGDGVQAGVRRLLLTASGGPFLRVSAAELDTVTPDQACAHPRWNMGRKISVDSASLMNKGLELIEASLLFNMPATQIEVVVHPQSIVHSLVEYIDGSVLAQLGNPDMRTPIACGLSWPQRVTAGVESLDLIRAGRLEFEAPDLQRFPCLRLAQQAAAAGGSAPAVLNAANEVAVTAFLNNELRFTGIPALIAAVLDAHSNVPVSSLEHVLELDRWARQHAGQVLQTRFFAAGTNPVSGSMVNPQTVECLQK
ncbi:MAG: 1-deoxy-D-xylulose-5-phosphate reductoisomerase [Steroidobacteraceae bacterium]